MSIHAARISKSPRLQKTLYALELARKAGGFGLTTKRLSESTGSMAVHTDVAELRYAGHKISCQFSHQTADKRRVYVYTLMDGP